MSRPDTVKLRHDATVRGSYYSVSDRGDIDEKTEYDVEKRTQPVQHSLNSPLYKSISHHDRRHHNFYKPKPNQTWVLCVFLFAISLCILLLELARYTHPDATSIPILQARHISVEKRSILRIRQDDAVDQPFSVTTTVLTSTAPPTPKKGETTIGGEPDAPNPDDQISITRTSPTPKKGGNTIGPQPEAPNLDDQITITNGGGTVAPNPNNQVTITSISHPVSSPALDRQISITTNGNGPSPPGLPQPDRQITISSNGGGTGQPAPDHQVTISSDRGATVTPGQPRPDAQISISTNGGGTGQPAPDLQVTISSDREAAVTPGQPAPNSQVSITKGGTSATNTAAAGLVLTGAASVVSGSLIVSGTAVIATVSEPVLASVVSGSLVVSGTAVIATVDPAQAAKLEAAAIGLVTLTNAAGVPTATVGYTGVVVATGADGKPTTISYSGDLVLTDSNGVPTRTLSDAIVMTDSSGRATRTLSYADSVVLTDSNGVPTKTILYGGTATQAAASAADGSAYKEQVFTQWSYFLAMYMPNILGVVMQASWLVVFATFKMMEPFYQLASPGGGSAQSTLIADYLSTGLSSSVFRTAAEGHWVMVLAGQVQFGLALIMVFVSETMNVVPTDYCKTEISDHQPCDPKWVVNTNMVRVAEVFLVACFSMIVMIIYLNRTRVSGVYSDPSRIATMADMLVHKPLIHELRDIPATASQKDIAHDLAGSRYMLGTFYDDGREQYGIVKVDTYNDAARTFVKEPFYKMGYRKMGRLSSHLSEGANKTVPFLPDFLCMGMAIVLFSIVTAYYTIDGHSKASFNVWMNSGRIGPNLLLSGMAVIMGFLVKRKERYFRLSHPYVVLSKGPAMASETVLAGFQSTPFSSVYRAFCDRDISLALLSLAAIFSDIILILTPGIPFNGAQTRPVYLSSTFIVLGLSGIIFIVMVRVTFKEWRSGNRYHECPETLASILIRLCASRFVEERNTADPDTVKNVFDGDDNEAQRRRYEGPNGLKMYTYGVMEGVDGVQRFMVEDAKHLGPSIHHYY